MICSHRYDLSFIFWSWYGSFLILLILLLLLLTLPAQVPGPCSPSAPSTCPPLLLPYVLLFPLRPAPFKPPPSPRSEISFCPLLSCSPFGKLLPSLPLRLEARRVSAPSPVLLILSNLVNKHVSSHSVELSLCIVRHLWWNSFSQKTSSICS